MQTNNKLREALEAIDKNTDLLDIAENIAPKLHPSHSFVAVQIRKIVRAALAEPLRNCDVGDVKEQAERFFNFCDGYMHATGYKSCGTCPLWTSGTVGHDCELRWSQMPYEEKEGK